MHRQAVISNQTPQTARDEAAAAAQYRNAILMQLGEDFFPFFDLAGQGTPSRPDGLPDQLYAQPRKAGLDSEPASVSQERTNNHCTCCRAGCPDSAGGAGPVRHNGRHHFGDLAAAETAHRWPSEKKLQGHALPSAPGAVPAAAPPACWPNPHGSSPEQWWLLSPSTEAERNAQSPRRSPPVFKPFDCRHCVKDFPKKADRDRHEASVHRGQMEKPPRMFYCNVNGCTRPRGFTRKDNLLDHVRRVHNLSIPKRQTRQQHLSERMSMG